MCLFCYLFLMKKIIVCLLVFSLLWISYSYGKSCTDDAECWLVNKCCNGTCGWPVCLTCSSDDDCGWYSCCDGQCKEACLVGNDDEKNVEEWQQRCPNINVTEENINYINQLDDNSCCFDGWGFSPACIEDNPSANAYWNLWINANDKCLINWQCSLNIYETLWIRKSNTDPEVQVFVQDVVLALTTFFGTVISLILIISWLMYILSSFKSDASWASKAKKGVFGSIVWLLLVSWSYAIIRLIQFIATWWGW